jgi:hypothetical protein
MGHAGLCGVEEKQVLRLGRALFRASSLRMTNAAGKADPSRRKTPLVMTRMAKNAARDDKNKGRGQRG